MLTLLLLSYQFTGKQLDRLAKKAEKEQDKEKAKMKKAMVSMRESLFQFCYDKNSVMTQCYYVLDYNSHWLWISHQALPINHSML